MDHNSAIGTCASCHVSGRPPAPFKSTTHFITTLGCEECHVTTSWTNTSYTHASPDYPIHNKTVTCLNCHKQNNQTITYQWPYGPDCAACHANKYVPGSHPKFGNTKYTVSELRDCSGACHIYTDASLATIKTRRNGPEHRPTAGGF
jgi:hypothetical protein